MTPTKLSASRPPRAFEWLWLAMMLAVSGCATLPPPASVPKAASHALEHPETTALGQRSRQAVAEHPGRSGFRILSAGVDGLLARIQMIDAAQRTLDIQYYIFRLDQSGGLITEGILRAADRGVRVRILLDDGETMPDDERLLMLTAHPGIEVRIFNPFAYRGHSNLLRAAEFVTSGGRVDYRMHNKLFVVDNAVALIGGRNIGDPYFQIDPMAQFGDDDVFAMGPIVPEMSLSFDQYWNCPMSIPADALSNGKPDPNRLVALRRALRDLRQAKRPHGADHAARSATGEPFARLLAPNPPLEWASATLVVDDPQKRTVVASGALGLTTYKPVADAIAAVRSELLVVTPFFVPGDDGVKLLTGLHKRGVDTRILTNSLESTPEPAAHSAYRRYRPALLAGGVHLYEVRARLGDAHGSGQPEWMNRFGTYGLHAKLFVFDRQRLFIGSLNFDKRSERINTEIGLIIDSPALAEQTARRFAAITSLANSYEVKLKSAPNTPDPQLAWVTTDHDQVVELTTEPARGAWQRVKVDLISTLPLDGEL